MLYVHLPVLSLFVRVSFSLVFDMYVDVHVYLLSLSCYAFASRFTFVVTSYVLRLRLRYVLSYTRAFVF